MSRGATATERGFTLVELIVTVAILGVAFVVVIGGMGASILGADVHRKQAVSETALRRFAEAVKAQPYVDCATTYAAAFSAPSGYTASMPVPIRYWDGSSFVVGCPYPERGLQLVTLRVASDDGRDVETVEMVKRRP